MFYEAPCGVYFDQGWMTPPVWMGSLPGDATPLIEQCAVYNELIGNNANVATPALTQPIQNTPLSIVETSSSGSMLFNFLVEFRDSTDTQFNGKFDVEVDIPYDASLCPGLIPGPTYVDGLQSYEDIPGPCALITPTQYQSAITSGHAIGWTVYNVVSQTAYGPKSPVPPNTPAGLVQSPGGYVIASIPVPYQTELSSTVVRVGMRFSEGYGTQMPIAFGCWPNPCNPDAQILPLYNGAMQGEWVWSQPFTVQVQPALLVQYSFLPAFILYQPPGDQSSASFQMLSSYTQQYTAGTTVSLTDSSELDNKTTSDYTLGGKGSIQTYLSENFSVKNDTAWDNSVKTASGNSYGDSTTALFKDILTQTYSTPKLPSSTTPEASLTFYEQPFWSDQIYFLVNPQFAIWEYPSGPVAAPLGAAAVLEASVAQLSACAGSYKFVVAKPQPLTQQYSLYINGMSQTFSVTLQPSDCVNLLQLDPFWVALSQAATPPMGLPLFDYSVPLTTSSGAYSQQQVTTFTTTTTGSQTFNTTISAAETNTITGTAALDVLVYTFGLGNSTANTTTDGTQFQIQLSTTQSATTETGLTSTITLQDCPSVKSPGSSNATDNCSVNENPIPVMIFQDNRFGTMLAQTPTLSIPFPWPVATVPTTVGTHYPVCIPCLNRPGYGFASGKFPSDAQQSFDPSLIKPVSTNLRPIISGKPAPPPSAPRVRHIVPKPPVAYTKALPPPQNLQSELPQIVAKFPKAKLAVKPPAGRTYPSSGTLQPGGKDGRPQLVQKP
jgi:hypothetical protein